MSTVVTLPDNHTATLRSRDDLTVKQARQLQRAAVKAGSVVQKLQSLGLEDLRSDEDDEAAKKERTAKLVSLLASLSDEESETMELYQREAIALLLDEWTLERSAPQTAADVDELPISLYQPLAKAVMEFQLDEDFSPDGGDGPLVTTTGEGSEG